MTETQPFSEVDLDLDIPCFWQVKDGPQCDQPASIQVRYRCPRHSPKGRVVNICQMHYAQTTERNKSWQCTVCGRQGMAPEFFEFLRLL